MNIDDATTLELRLGSSSLKMFDKYLASKASKIVFCFTQFILTLVNGGKWWEKYPCLSGLIQLGDESSAYILLCFVLYYTHITIYTEIFINIISSDRSSYSDIGLLLAPQSALVGLDF